MITVEGPLGHAIWGRMGIKCVGLYVPFNSFVHIGTGALGAMRRNNLWNMPKTQAKFKPSSCWSPVQRATTGPWRTPEVGWLTLHVCRGFQLCFWKIKQKSCLMGDLDILLKDDFCHVEKKLQLLWCCLRNWAKMTWRDLSNTKVLLSIQGYNITNNKSITNN